MISDFIPGLRRALQIVFTATTLSGLVAECENDMNHSLNQAIQVSATPTIAIDHTTYRTLTATFYPAVAAPGHSYPAATAQVHPHVVIDPLTKDGRTIDRWLYQVDNGFDLVLLVENDRVIGYDFLTGGAL